MGGKGKSGRRACKAVDGQVGGVGEEGHLVWMVLQLVSLLFLWLEGRAVSDVEGSRSDLAQVVSEVNWDQILVLKHRLRLRGILVRDIGEVAGWASASGHAGVV